MIRLLNKFNGKSPAAVRSYMKRNDFTTALFFQWAATAYVAALSMGLIFILGRMLAPVAFGDYSCMVAAASFFAIIQDGGFKTLIFREKTSPTSGLAGQSDALLPLAMGHTAVATMLGACLGLLLFPGKGPAAAVACFGCLTVTNLVSAELKADGRFSREALWQVLVRTTGACGILLLVLLFSPTPLFIFIGWSLGLMLCMRLSPTPIPRPRFRGIGTPGIKGTRISFMAIDAATIIYFRCDILLLGYLLEEGPETGCYAAAYHFLGGIILFAAPLGGMLFRKLRQTAGRDSEFKALLLKTILLFIGAAGVFILSAHLLGDWIVRLTFGAAYEGAAPLLKLLFWSLLFVLPNTVLTQAAVALNSERYYALAAGTCAVVNIVLNLILIPRLGGAGAAWATIAAEAVLFFMLLRGIGTRLPLLKRESPAG